MAQDINPQPINATNPYPKQFEHYYDSSLSIVLTYLHSYIFLLW